MILLLFHPLDQLLPRSDVPAIQHRTEVIAFFISTTEEKNLKKVHHCLMAQPKTHDVERKSDTYRKALDQKMLYCIHGQFCLLRNQTELNSPFLRRTAVEKISSSSESISNKNVFLLEALLLHNQDYIHSCATTIRRNKTHHSMD